MGLLWAGVVLRLGLSAEVIAGLVFASLLIGIAVTDAALFIIPSEYSFGGFVLGVLWALRPGGISLSQGLLGALVGAALIWLVGVIGTWWAKREAMGTGDINMMAMVGMFLGWRGVLVTVLLGSLLGVLIVGPVALVRRERYLKLPFGVFLALGAVVAFVIGDAIIRWYVGFAIGG
jgi:leader peptidase (prepilin peptidase)/N-methyltransferase